MEDQAETMEDQPGSPELFLFLASTVHDMKNSISVLSGTLENLLGTGGGPAGDNPAYSKMSHMLYQTKRLNDNLIQLLALYKQVGKPAYPFDAHPRQVGELVQQVTSQVAILLESNGITLETEFSADLIWNIDEDLIIGVLSHAIHNAVRYTHDHIRLVIAERDGWLELRVEDNGAGFPASLLNTGGPATSGTASAVNFVTNSSGLGLYFASEVARMHRHRQRSGTVRLENGGALGGGCFVLRLP